MQHEKQVLYKFVGVSFTPVTASVMMHTASFQKEIVAAGDSHAYLVVKFNTVQTELQGAVTRNSEFLYCMAAGE